MSAAGDAQFLPALIEALPGDGTRARQHQFTRARQAKFLSRLADSGSVVSAARAAAVSRQTVYRQRRVCPSFRNAWDAALVVALEQAEAELAVRAIDGVEEIVWYHGEEVGKRLRHDPRLLLAHLARLDRKAADPALAALAEGFEDMLASFADGGDVVRPDVAEPRLAGGAASSAGQCNTCSMSDDRDADVGGTNAGLCGGPDAGERGGPYGAERGARGTEPRCECAGAPENGPHWEVRDGALQPVVNAAGEGPCCDSPNWPGCRDCPHYPSVSRALNEMEEQRPADAPSIHAIGGDPGAVEAAQMDAFIAGEAEWWRLNADYALCDADGRVEPVREG